MDLFIRPTNAKIRTLNILGYDLKDLFSEEAMNGNRPDAEHSITELDVSIYDTFQRFDDGTKQKVLDRICFYFDRLKTLYAKHHFPASTELKYDNFCFTKFHICKADDLFNGRKFPGRLIVGTCEQCEKKIVEVEGDESAEIMFGLYDLF